MTTVKVFAPAKINLTLHVTGQRDDGYHLLDSLVAFAWVGDRLTFAESSSNSLVVTGPFAKDVPASDDNIIYRAADLMGLSASITLEKNLPVASGIGGGSSDAAATLKGLSKLYNKALPDAAAILELGADVPVCMAGGLTRMRGIGDDLTVIDTERMAWPMVLVNPGVQVSTPQVFTRLSTKENSPMEDPFSLGPAVAPDDAFPGWIARQRNDLEAPAIEIAPVIRDVLDALRRQKGCQIARMSGSGATCFALFDHEDAAKDATVRIGAQFPKWWVALSDQPGF